MSGNGDSQPIVETGIYIRAKIGDRFETIDIGDARLPMNEFCKWLFTHAQSKPFFYIRLVTSLIGRRQDFEKFLEECGGEEAVIRSGGPG